MKKFIKATLIGTGVVAIALKVVDILEAKKEHDASPSVRISKGLSPIPEDDE